MFTLCLLVGLAVGQGETATTPPLPDGTFYGVAGIEGFRSLYKMKLGQEPERIGRRGDVDFYLYQLVWDPIRETLFGVAYVNEIRTWVEIDPKTGQPQILPWTYSSGNGNWAGPYSMTLDPTDGMIYLLPGCAVEDFPCSAYRPGTIARFDPGTGELKTVYASPVQNDYLNGLVYVADFLGKYTGLLTDSSENGGLNVFVGPSLARTRIGGVTYRVGYLFSDPANGTIYSGSPTDFLFGFDNEFGAMRKIFDGNNSDWPTFPIGAFAYAPNVATLAPTCRLSDSDSDVDIDLHDFANFQNCWTGPN